MLEFLRDFGLVRFGAMISVAVPKRKMSVLIFFLLVSVMLALRLPLGSGGVVCFALMLRPAELYAALPR